MENSYTTKQGEHILSLLQSEPGKHFTADDIMKSLSENGTGVGKATVYRHLEKLIKRGVVRKYIVEEGISACYAYVGNPEGCSGHYHLKCSSCGKLIHLKCDYLDKVADHVFDRHGFVISPEKTVLYGICKECREAEHEN